MQRFVVPIVGLITAAGLSGLLGFRSPIAPFSEQTAVLGETVSGCTATDGDTIRCGNERVRLLAIDAPELPGHCRKGRDCAPGDPFASTASLEQAMIGTMRIERFGTDRYGRTLAALTGDKGDLSCWQLVQHHAVYRARWDDGLRIARTCPGSIL